MEEGYKVQLDKIFTGLMRHATTVTQVYEALLYGLIASTGAAGAFLIEGLNLTHTDMTVGSLKGYDLVKNDIRRPSPGELKERESIYLYTSKLVPWTIGLDGGEKPGIIFVEYLIGTASTLVALLKSLDPKKRDKDALTGLYNKESFIQDLAVACTSASKGSIPLHLLFIDLNNFKAVNDSLGHDVGDKVLLNIAHKIWRILSGYGVVYRHGGDEFCVILAGVTYNKAIELKNRIESEAVHKVRGITVSSAIGMASYQEGMTAAALLKEADIRMYDHKSQAKQLLLMGEDNVTK